MEENTEPGESGGIDRRRLIKRAGIIGAGVAAWSAPSVTSLAGRAYAAGSGSTPCKSCGSFDIPSCNDHKLCFCYARQDGSGCFCGQDLFCVDAVSCSSDADCSSGSVCIDAQNGCQKSICVPDCDSGGGGSVGEDAFRRQASVSGPRASGR